MNTKKGVSRIAQACLLLVLLVSCVEKKKSRDYLVGVWKPVDLELKGIPGLLKKQLNIHDLEKEFLNSEQKLGLLELQSDNSFVLDESILDLRIKGQWTFAGDTLKLIGNELPYPLVVEEWGPTRIQLNLAPVYASKINLENIPVQFLNHIKILVTYRRVD